MRLLAGSGVALTALILAPVLLIGVLIGGIAISADNEGTAVDPTKIPPLAARLLPRITALTSSTCPELPSLWVVAHVEAESSWDPSAFAMDRNGGSAGFYQLNQQNWISAGGQRWDATPPTADADVVQPERHLDLAIPWVCANLRRVTAHLASTGKSADPLDAMLVCHIAGCDRVTESATGIPTAGEAGCNAACAERITTYLNHVRQRITAFSTSAVPVSIADLPTPAAYGGAGIGCTEPDPTSSGCLTASTRHALAEIYAAFGRPGPTTPIRSTSCWDRHAWNPSSDHPKGRACDLFPARAGDFPAGGDLANGWRLATWLRTHAAPLRVKYLIWQGRFWSPSTDDQNGWGKPYTGGGIYNPADATGGHFDHVHVSFVT